MNCFPNILSQGDRTSLSTKLTLLGKGISSLASDNQLFTTSGDEEFATICAILTKSMCDRTRENDSLMGNKRGVNCDTPLNPASLQQRRERSNIICFYHTPD